MGRRKRNPLEEIVSSFDQPKAFLQPSIKIFFHQSKKTLSSPHTQAAEKFAYFKGGRNRKGETVLDRIERLNPAIPCLFPQLAERPHPPPPQSAAVKAKELWMSLLSLRGENLIGQNWSPDMIGQTPANELLESIEPEVKQQLRILLTF